MYQGFAKQPNIPSPELFAEKNGHSVGASCRVDREGDLLRECSLPAVSNPPTLRKDAPLTTIIPPIERAALIHEALHGGVFGFRPDKALTVKAIASIPTEDRLQLEREYQSHYGVSLKADLRARLPAPLARRTSALLEGELLRADIHTVYGELNRWWGRDIESVMTALRRSSGVRFEEVAHRFYHRSPEDLIQEKLSGAAKDRALLLARGEFAAADATHLNALLKKTWFRGESITTFLSSLSSEERMKASTAYHNLFGSQLSESIKASLPPSLCRHACALLGNNIHEEKACLLHKEIDKIFPSTNRIIEMLVDTPPEIRVTLKRSFVEYLHEDLDLMIRSRFKLSDAEQILEVLKTGAISPAARLDRALKGIWSNEKEILGALLNRSAEEITEIRRDYYERTGRHLRGDIADHLSGRDKFRALLTLGGSPKTAEDALALLYVQQEFEKLSLSHYILRCISKKPALLRNSLERLSSTYKRVWQDLELTGSERRELTSHLTFAFQDLESYKHAKGKVSEVGSNLFMSASGVALAALAGPTFGPAGALVFSTAGAALAKIAAKAVLIGRGYGWQSMPKDYLVGVLLRLRGQGGKRLIDATRTVIDLLS